MMKEKGITEGEKLCQISVNDQLGFIDKTGKVVIEPKFDGAESFSGGLAKVWIGKRYGHIDKKGKYVWEPT
jgi:hypothetical protein